ncbi:MAG: NAD(P)/FAD-dependent oxidoreductase [Flammeovirgaceae bacterium]
MLSFWERQSFLEYDYIIIGSGLVGLSAAAYLKESDANCSVLVLERGLFPAGASTKNAGFACFGSLTELLADLKIMSEDELLTLVESRWKGLLKLRNRLSDQAIGLLPYGGYELIDSTLSASVEQLETINELIQPIFQSSVFELQNEKIQEFGFGEKYVEQLVYNQFEGQIDTGKMMRSLLAYVQTLGVTILNNCEVANFEELDDHVLVSISGYPVQFRGQKLGICTNAFSRSLMPELNLEPGRGQVLVTQPIEGLKFKGVFHMDEGYYYFRNFKNRVIFGGGRNLDFVGESTTEFGTTSPILKSLAKKLKNIILPEQEFAIDHTWSGIMAFGTTKKPIVKSYSARIELGVRLGGMGVALGSNVGELVAERMMGKHTLT